MGRNKEDDEIKMTLDIKSWLIKNRGKATALGICPLCDEIVTATLHEALKSKFIPIFVASPRQIDANRGYTNWSQEEFVEFVGSKCKELGYKGSIIIARDHGGPYQSNRDRGKIDVSLEDAMTYAKEMFVKDIKCGFHILHIDATEDPVAGMLEMEEIVRRTAELIDYIEDIRMAEKLPEVYYEVGTEELTGGITEPQNFEIFIRRLKSQLKKLGREKALNSLLFIVGQVGTSMKIDMSNSFVPERARALVEIASKYDLFLKVHYTDWLPTFILKQFPRLGIGAANVGPELWATFLQALADLEKMEIQVLKGKVFSPSNIISTVEKVAIKKAPWRTLMKDIKKDELKKFAQTHRSEIALFAGRYVMNDSEVIEAKKKLYQNLEEFSLVHPYHYVINCIRTNIRKYVKAFNLIASI